MGKLIGKRWGRNERNFIGIFGGFFVWIYVLYVKPNIIREKRRKDFKQRSKILKYTGGE